MTTLQLVRHASASGQARVDAVENIGRKPPMAFAEGGDKPLLLGSERLLSIAYGLRADYRITSMTFTDYAGNRVNDYIAEHLTASLRAAAKSSDRGAFDEVVDNEMTDLYLLAVELQDRTQPRHGVVTIYRQGVVEVNSEEQLKRLKPRLSAAVLSS